MHATVLLSPHGNARYFLDGNRPLFWYILLQYSATTVMYSIFYIYFIYFWGYSHVRVVLRCQYSTFTEHENHQTSDVNMKYSKEHNKRQCPDHRQTFAANRQRSQARATPPDVNCFITRPKPLRVPYTQYGFSSRVPCFRSCSCV